MKGSPTVYSENTCKITKYPHSHTYNSSLAVLFAPLVLADLCCSGCWLRGSRHLITHALQTLDQVALNLAPVPLMEELLSLYVNIKASPLDKGLEQVLSLLW